MRHLFLTGFMGAGKTTVGRLVADRLGRPFIDLDAEITRREGMSVPDIFRQRGEESFRESEHDALQALGGAEPAVVATGGGVVLRPENRTLLSRLGTVVYLAVTPEEALARVGATPDRPLLVDGGLAVARAILDARLALYAHTADHVVATVGRTPAEVAEAVAHAVSGPAAHVIPVGEAGSGGAYDVVVGIDLLDGVGLRIRDIFGDVAIGVVSDERVWSLLGGRIGNAIEASDLGYSVHLVPAGEQAKSWEIAGGLLERFADAELDRRSVVLAVGGGSVGDLAGFCAATYMRGIPVVQVPTTLLAQVDSSVGGKTAVDLAAGKNLAGAFWPPGLVVADVGTLATLPGAEITNGLVEAIKAALLAGGEPLERMETAIEAVLARDVAATGVVVRDAVAFKAAVVTEDLRESGLRECLNFGHTFGHAIEMLAGFGTLAHGLAVAEGIRFALALGERLGVTDRGVGERVSRLLERAGAGTATVWDVLDGSAASLTAAAVLAAMRGDKKARAGIVRFVLLERPGSWRASGVDDDVLLPAVTEWLAARGETSGRAVASTPEA